ncbi:MAG TPA: flagellar basal-body rod protein FlgF [Devosia sp.]|nr:flagellar basal-body rod protein FlgF [Devosia sp.]
MENAQLVSLSRQIALQRQMDVVANNMANINTTGFKAEDILFEQYQMPGAADNDFAGKQSVDYTQDWATVHDLTVGPLQQTGNPLDVALSGGGFLTVQTPAGNRYTKAGSLAINAQGVLVDLSGNPVLSDAGTPITFDDTDTNITILKNGTVSTSQGTKGRLAVVEFPNTQALTREGNNLWNGPNARPATNTDVLQGTIERSNVSGVTEMANMIRVQRAYEQLADLMQKQDDLRSNAVQKLGSVSTTA